MDGSTRDKFFDAVNEGYDALLTPIEAAEARGHKASSAVIAEARNGGKEVVTLARKWTDDPTNVFENLEAAAKAQGRAQKRRLGIARDAVEGVGEFGADVQEALRRVVKANAKAGEATAEAAQGVARKAYGRIWRGDEAEEDAGANGRKHAKPAKLSVAAGASTNSGEVVDS